MCVHVHLKKKNQDQQNQTTRIMFACAGFQTQVGNAALTLIYDLCKLQ